MKASRHQHVRGSRPRRWAAGVLLLLFAAIPGGALLAQGESLTVRYFQQLRERRLFSVAEQLGMERLSDPLITPEEFIQFSVELSKTYAEHARSTSGEEHEQYWLLAETVLDDALAKHQRHPRSLLLEVQRAFLPADRGAFLRGQVELFPLDEKLQEQAEEVFETALERLKPIVTELAQRHRQLTVKGQRGPGELATFEIYDLHDEARFRLGVTLQEYAKTTANFTGERSRLLREAQVWLNALAEGPPGGQFKLPAKLHLAENHRLRDDFNGADLILKELEENPLPEELETKLVIERVRWLIAKGQLNEALDRLKEHRQDSWRNAGELAYLQVDILMTRWESADRANDSAKTQQLSQDIEALLKSLQPRLSGYWGYRVSLLGEQLKQAQKYGTEVAAIVRRAESRYAGGEQSSAATEYGRAAELAAKNGKAAIAFDLGYTQGSILVQLQQFDDAAKVFEKLAKDFPKNERTPDAHLLEGYSLGKLYEKNPTEAHREEYANHLKSHVEQYPRHETAGDAYWMLGQHEEQRRQNTLALSYYRNIPTAHRLGLAAQLAVARCYEKVIERLHELHATAEEAHKPAFQERTLEWEQAGATELARFIEAYPQEPVSLDRPQADVVLQLARLQLMRTKPEYQKADSLLERILVSGARQLASAVPANERAEWSRILKTSRQLRIVSLAGQGSSDQAEKLVKELSESSTQDVLGVMDGLMLIAKKADPATRRKLGQLQLQTATELNSRRSELDAAEQERLDHCRAQAYLATNQPAEALQVYNQLLARQPKNRGLRQQVAERLTGTDDRTSLTKAKELWGSLEASENPGSVSWLEHRYQIALCSWKLGQTEECRKLIGVTKLLYPKLGNAELRAKYEQLEAKLPGK